jgi:glycogen(starch) synthase
MRILFVCNEFPPSKHGGIGVFIKNLVSGLTSEGVHCEVIGIYPISKKEVEFIDGVEVIKLAEVKLAFFECTRLFRVIKGVLNKWKLSNYIKNYERSKHFDLIESYEWNGPLLFKPKTKLIIRLHGSNSAYAKFENLGTSRYLKYFEGLNLKISDEVISVSEHMRKITEITFGKLEVPNRVIYNSYNSGLFKLNTTIVRNPYQIVFVGKFHARKGVFELFKIVNTLMSLNSNYIFEFVGAHSNENAKDLLSIIKTEYRQRIKFTAYMPQSELPKIYSEAAIMIMPSRAEAFGLTAIEAMACGCLVAMSALPIATEIIDDNIDGILINPTNYIDSAISIDNLLKDVSRVSEMRAAAIKKVCNKFSSSSILKENLEFYNSTIIND